MFPEPQVTLESLCHALSPKPFRSVPSTGLPLDPVLRVRDSALGLCLAPWPSGIGSDLTGELPGLSVQGRGYGVRASA